MLNKVVIDFSAFFFGKDRRVIIKELTVVDVDSSTYQHWIFKPPTEDREMDTSCASKWKSISTARYNRWLSEYNHGLRVSSGDVAYESLYDTLDSVCSGANLVYAITTEKAKILENVLANTRVVLSMETLGCPLSPTNLFPDDEHETQCLWHFIYAPGFLCTVSTAVRAARWCATHPEKINMNDATVREKTFAGWAGVSNPSPKQLAEQGFVYDVNTEDSVKCVYCNLVLHKWDEGDNAREDHEFNSPFCMFVRYQRQLTGPKYDINKSFPCCGGKEPVVITQEEVFDNCHL